MVTEMTEQELLFLCIETSAQELRAATGLEINFPQVLEAHIKTEKRMLDMLGPCPDSEVVARIKELEESLHAVTQTLLSERSEKWDELEIYKERCRKMSKEIGELETSTKFWMESNGTNSKLFGSAQRDLDEVEAKLTFAYEVITKAAAALETEQAGMDMTALSILREHGKFDRAPLGTDELANYLCHVARENGCRLIYKLERIDIK